MAKKPTSGPVSLHKVIMVGSGGVGKSAVSSQKRKEFFLFYILHYNDYESFITFLFFFSTKMIILLFSAHAPIYV